jgi:hypothetical protein
MSRNRQTNFSTTQPDLFGPPPPQSYAPTLEKVRSEVGKVLDTARAAKVLPWTQKELAYWKTVFPQMTRWLPEEEAAKVRIAFMEELRRLKA